MRTRCGDRLSSALVVRRWPERRLVVLSAAAALLALAMGLAPGSGVAPAPLTALAALPVLLVGLELGAVAGIAVGALGFGVVAWQAAEVTPSADPIELVATAAALVVLGAVAGRFSDRMRDLRRRHEHVLESGLQLSRRVGYISLTARVAHAAMHVADVDGVLVSIDGEAPVRVGNVGHPSLVIPLFAGSVPVGRLEVSGSAMLGPEDRAVLELVALQAGQARGNELAMIREGQRARAESELRLAQERLLEQRSEVDHLLTSQEDERRRVAAKLHDELAQVLAAVLMGLGLVSHQDSAHEADALAALRGQVITVLDDMRALAVGLRSPALAQLGLLVALESLARDMRERGEAEMVVRAVGEIEPIPELVETVAYRIVEEALRIAQGDTAAAPLQIRVARETRGPDARLDLVLELPNVRREPSLAGISARVNLMSGTLHAETSAEQGTRLRVELPLAGYGQTASAA